MLTSCFHLKNTHGDDLQVGKENRCDCYHFDPKLLLFRGELMKESVGAFLLIPCSAFNFTKRGEQDMLFPMEIGWDALIWATPDSKTSRIEQWVNDAEKLLVACGTLPCCSSALVLALWHGLPRAVSHLSIDLPKPNSLFKWVLSLFE